MLALAGIPLGLRFRTLSPGDDPPVVGVAQHIDADYDDANALDRFAHGLDVITFEFENVPVDAVRRLARDLPVWPPPRALEIAQDRLAEKEFFQRLGVPTAPFLPVDSRDQLDGALAQLGTPAILKTRRWGYDGKGQLVIDRVGQAAAAWQRLGGVPLILEGFVHFDRELSVLAVRACRGAVACYPLVENTHADGILRVCRAPAPGTAAQLQHEAEQIARAALDHLDYVGVLAIELFEVAGQLLANEMAPRVHNSGHWTIEGAETSQFENHLRAILDLSLGATSPRGASLMLNLIGELPAADTLLAMPGAHLHLYGKTPRPGRKLGHLTVRADDTRELDAALAYLRPIVRSNR